MRRWDGTVNPEKMGTWTFDVHMQVSYFRNQPNKAVRVRYLGTCLRKNLKPGECKDFDYEPIMFW